MFKKILLAPFALALGLVITVPIIGTLAIAILVGFAILPILILYVIFYVAYETITGDESE